MSGGVSEAFQRYVEILKLLPPKPPGVHVGLLKSRLAARGIETTDRTIQRDLVELSRILPIHCYQDTKPYRWSWEARADPLHIPALDLHTALTLELVERFLKPVLPRLSLAHLEPYFKRARNTLKSAPGLRLSGWPAKVRILERGQPLTPPKVDSRVLDTVYTALLEERHFKVRYRKRGEKTSSERIVNPLGLVYRSSMAYLVCTLPADEAPMIKQMLLHRMSQPELLDAVRTVPRAFDLDDYIATGSFGFRLGKSPVRLKVAFDPRAGVAVQESSLSKDQQLSERKDGWIVVQATVPNTIELSVWLLGFGAMVEVLEPKALREQFQQLTREMAALYGGRKKKAR